MSVLKFARNAVAAAAALALPVHAASAVPTFDGRAAAVLAEANGQDDDWDGITQYAIPVVIVVVVGLGLYFLLDEDDSGVSA